MLPPTLLSGEGWRRLRSIAEQLPLGVIDQPFGFEIALDHELAEADFCVCPVRGSPLAAHFISNGEAAPHGSAAASLGACLARDEDDPTSFLSRRDGGIILEYDVPDVIPEEPAVPGIFFVPRSNSAAAARRLHDDPVETITTLWDAAAWRDDAAELLQVQRLYEALPGESYVVQAGVLPGRHQRAIRLVVHRVDTAELPGLLKRLRWSGSPDAVMSVISNTEALTRPGSVLSLDVTADGISPRLGLELFRSVETARIDSAGWQPMIDRLVDRGWCVPVKAEGLRAWPRLERLIGPGGIYRLHSTINHFKVVVENGCLTAKAYAAVYSAPLRMDNGAGNGGK